jgi:hypothetical protein
VCSHHLLLSPKWGNDHPCHDEGNVHALLKLAKVYGQVPKQATNGSWWCVASSRASMDVD